MIIVFVIGMIALQSYGQDGFKWNKVDSVNKTKSEIYSDTKTYIAKTWNSAQNVIQNDDKDAGIILIKGSSKQSTVYCLSTFEYNYNYTITFMIKDNKVKILCSDVICNSAYGGNVSINLLPPFDGENYTGTGMNKLSKKKQLEVMGNLRSDLQNIIDKYLLFVKSPSINTGW